MSKTTRNAPSSKALEHPLPMPVPPLSDAYKDLRVSVDRFCLLAGIEALAEMLAADAEAVCGPRHARTAERRGHRWGTTTSELAFQGARVKLERPRVREPDGGELSLPSFELMSDPELLHAWAMNLMVMNVSTRKYGRAVRLPADAGGDLPSAAGDGSSKSAVSRRFVALTRSKLKAWLASRLEELDLLVVQIDGLHVGDHVMVAAIGIDAGGEKHVLGLAEGATENTATVQALLDNLIDRGLDPERPRLYIVDGAKALSKAIRRSFGPAALIQRCQVHKGRNITDRLDESLHAGVRKALRQAWDQGDADKAERLLRNLARRLEHDAPGVSATILEGLDEILTVIRLGLPPELRRALACTNAIENALARSGPCNATSSAGATPRWRCAGPPPAFWRPRKPSAASRPTGNSPSSTPPCVTPSRRQNERPPLKTSTRPRSLEITRCLPRPFQHRAGHRRWACG